MNQNPGIDAVRTLAHMGYRFTVAGETVKVKYHGSGKPDSDTVRLLHEVMKAHKQHVLTYLSKPAPASPPATCESCPWYELNPWTHYPDFGAWCHFRMEHLVVDSAVCEEFQHGKVSARQNHERVPSTSPAPQAPAPGERVLKTMDRTSVPARARTTARLF